MRLPQIKRFLTEDFNDQKDWIGKLFQPLNQFMETLANGLNRGIMINENLDAEVLDVTVTEGQLPVSFKISTRSRPRGVAVTGAQNLTLGNRSIMGALGLEWEYLPATHQIRINKVFGLNTGEKYRLTLLIHTS